MNTTQMLAALSMVKVAALDPKALRRVQAFKGLMQEMAEEGRAAKMPRGLLQGIPAEAPVASSVPQGFGTVPSNQAGMFAAFDAPKPAVKFNPKMTMRGTAIPGELPAIRPLPTKMGASRTSTLLPKSKSTPGIDLSLLKLKSLKDPAAQKGMRRVVDTKSPASIYSDVMGPATGKEKDVATASITELRLKNQRKKTAAPIPDIIKDLPVQALVGGATGAGYGALANYLDDRDVMSGALYGGMGGAAMAPAMSLLLQQPEMLRSLKQQPLSAMEQTAAGIPWGVAGSSLGLGYAADTEHAKKVRSERARRAAETRRAKTANAMRVYDPFFAAQQKILNNPSVSNATREAKNFWSRIPGEYKASLLGAATMGVPLAALNYYTEPEPEVAGVPSYFVDKPGARAIAGGVTGALTGGALGYNLRRMVGYPLSNVKDIIEGSVIPGAPTTKDLSEAERFVNYVKEDLPNISNKKIRAQMHPDALVSKPDYDPAFAKRMFETVPSVTGDVKANKPDPFAAVREAKERLRRALEEADYEAVPDMKKIQNLASEYDMAHMNMSRPQEQAYDNYDDFARKVRKAQKKNNP